MNSAIENLVSAQQRALSTRPKVGGFPHLAEVLRQAGVQKNVWHLPSCQSLYVTKLGNVIMPGQPLINQMIEVPNFNQAQLIKALRIDQAGEGTFAEFLQRSWEAGVVSYVVDFEKRHVVYYGILGEEYLENYPAVVIS